MISDDKNALAAILECLRYAEREIALLDEPMTATVRAKAYVESALDRPTKHRGSRRR